MPNNIKSNKMKNIWLIGVGTIGIEYTKVLKELGYKITAIGRGSESAKNYQAETGIKPIEGGLDAFLSTSPTLPTHAIVAVNLQQLATTTLSLVKYGIKNILCEKPGFNSPDELEQVYQCVKDHNVNVFYAYNRRFYASTLKAEEYIIEDGGVLSFNFEFTEWAHVIEKTNYSKEILRNWFYANSSHVVDLAFFLGGQPKLMECFTTGELSWHKPSNFSGAGISEKDALFSYQANWNAPGRWFVEILTTKHRLYFKPMETIQVQEKGSVKVEPVPIDDTLDKLFKPGFYLETKAFVEGNHFRLCSIQEQYKHLNNVYYKIMGLK